HQRTGPVARARRLEPAVIAHLATCVRAVDLASVVGRTNVRHLRAPCAPEFPEALGDQHRAPPRARAKTCARANGTTSCSPSRTVGTGGSEAATSALAFHAQLGERGSSLTLPAAPVFGFPSGQPRLSDFDGFRLPFTHGGGATARAGGFPDLGRARRRIRAQGAQRDVLSSS